jgi:hypothetical protein
MIYAESDVLAIVGTLLHREIVTHNGSLRRIIGSLIGGAISIGCR